METNNINFNQIEFGKLEPNSLYAVKFPDWQVSTISSVIKKFNEEGKEYGIRFVPLFQGIEIVNGEEINNFIELYTINPIHDVLVNLNHVTSITVQCLPQEEVEYWVNLVGDEGYRIDREQYEAIKAKLIGNNSKE